MRQKNWMQNEDKRQKWMAFMQSFHPDIDPETLHLMDELGYVFRSIYHMRERSVDEAGLSYAQYQVLMHLFFAEQIGQKGELNPSEISERQGVSRNTMSAFIRNLEEEGLVERRLDPHDRRRFNISLTDGGRAVVGQHTRDHLSTVDRCFSTLTEDERQTLSRLLQKLGAHVKAMSQDDCAVSA